MLKTPLTQIPPPLLFLIGLVCMYFTPNYLPFPRFFTLVVIFFILCTVFSLGSVLRYLFNKKAPISPLNLHNTQILFTDGLYRLSRNPMYLSLVWALMAWFCYLGNGLAFWYIPFFVYWVTEFQIKVEEKALLRLFAQDYLDYQRNVRRWL